MKNKKRKTFGLLIEVEGYVEVEGYKTLLRSGITDTVRENDINLICFAGGALYRSPYNWSEKQRNIIYKFIQPDIIDGLLIISTIGSFATEQELKDFYSNFKSIPTVYIGGIWPGIPSIIIDNNIGMRELLKHLIVDHKNKKIAFIKGLKDNAEAELRFDIFKEVLTEFNIKFNPKLIVQGDYLIQSGKKAVKELLDKRKVKFDSIVAANDHMALGAIEELQEKGINVPEDVTVVGYDDTLKATALIPTLTTVHQPVYELGVKATEILISLLNGEKVQEFYKLPTELVKRQSCGCFSYNVYKIKEMDIKNDNYEGLEELKNNKNKIINELLDEIIIKKYDKDKIRMWLLILMKAFISELELNKEEKYENFFVKSLYKILKSIVLNGNDLSNWQYFITIFYKKVSRIIIEDKYSILLNNIFHQARILLGELIQPIITKIKLDSEFQLEKLNNLGQELLTKLNINKISEHLYSVLPEVNIKICLFALYKEVNEEEIISSNKLPEWSKIILSYNRKKSIKLDDDGRYYQTYFIISDYLSNLKSQFTIVAEPLFFDNKQLGFIFLEESHNEGIIYEMLRTQISNAIFITSLYSTQKLTEKSLIDTLMELEYINKKLNSLSLIDELTGFYNKKGFYSHVEQNISISNRRKSTFLLIIIKINDYNEILDRYGEEEGKNCLFVISRILKETFRKPDIISRTDEYEFMIIAVDADENQKVQILSRIENNLKIYNNKSKKLYNLSILIGMKVFDGNSDVPIDDLIMGVRDNLRLKVSEI